MMITESRISGTGVVAARSALVGLVSAFLMSCMSTGLEPQGAAAPAEAPGSWLNRQQLQFSEGLGRMREQVDVALQGTRDNAGDALRRVRSRAIVASDACFSIDETEGCTIAARSACQRASYADGAPLASSTYVACSGVWGMRAADAPDGACKTKRRLNAALCW